MQPVKKKDIFMTIAEKDFIGVKKDVRASVQFLHLKKSDVSKAINQPIASIRYDDRIPQEVKQRVSEIGNIINLVAGYFDGDLEKTQLWFNTENPLLGDISPRDMIRYGRYTKLRKFIFNALAGNTP